MLCISGGRDSVALLTAMLQAGIRPILFHCAYGLRGEESEAEVDLVQKLADDHGLEMKVHRVPPDWNEACKAGGLNIQQEARRLRYRLATELALQSEPAGLVATAHHADDQSETVLMALLQGRGLRRMAGLRSDRMRWRPWLEVESSQIQAFADCYVPEYSTDSSNLESDYDRNYLRNRVAPLLDQRFASWKENLIREAADWQRLRLALEAEARDRFHPWVTEVKDAWYGRMFRVDQAVMSLPLTEYWSRECWLNLGAGRAQAEALLKAWELQPGKKLPCGQGTVFRHRNALCYIEFPSGPEGSHRTGEVAWEALGHRWQGRVPNTHKDGSWELRPWQAGDRLPQGGGLVSDLLQETGIEKPFKDSWPVLCDRDGVRWCPLPGRSGPVEDCYEWPSGEGVLQWNWTGALPPHHPTL